MRAAELKSAAPVEPAAPEPAAEATEPQGTSCVTPSGVTIEYEWAPRRLYRLNGTEVPSVTTVLNVLDKSGPLTWWAQKIGVEGTQELYRRGVLAYGRVPAPEAQEIVDLLVEHKLSVNHVKDSAADRGVNVHGALDMWVKFGAVPDPQDEEEWGENERGYIQGLQSFLVDVSKRGVPKADAELMVGSLEHQYAGRFDLVLTLSKSVEVVTRVYPKRPPKVEEIPAGKYLLDLKTSKRVYDTHFLQLEAYEHAAQECGYGATDHRGVVHVAADGRYELVLNQDWTLDDFLAVRKVYRVMNEREILRTLREDLGAKEVSA